MRRHKAQVAVLGAGPAGAIAARQLGLAGIDALLIDPLMPHKGQGIESFPPSGAPLAEELGLLQAFCAVSDGPAEAMQMVWREAPELRAFEGAGPLLLHRGALHESLREEALRYARALKARVRDVGPCGEGVQLQTDAGKVQCDLVIDARGRHANKRPATDLTALPFTARGESPAFMMGLEALPDGWFWACSLPEGQVQGVVFQPAAALAGEGAAARAAYLRACLAESDCFPYLSAITVGKPAAAGLSAVGDPVVTARHLLVGDAALARDPIASHGLVHALRSGVQTAIAALTILDPTGDDHAAQSFLRHKHQAAVVAAQLATDRAYADQSRFQTAFWTARSAHEAQSAPAALALQGPVTLAAPLTRAPVLSQDRIHWAPAIELRAQDDFLTGLGPVTALDVAAACRPAAPLKEIANRLGRQHDMPLVFKLLERLTLGGAFVQVRPTA